MAAIGTRKLKLEIDGTNYTPQVSNVRITSGEADSDFVTFEDAANGGARDYALVITLVQDAAAGTLWREIFDSAGTDVPYTVMPYGNAAPTAGEPHFEGTATITEPDGDLLGGEANKSNTAKMTIEVTFPCTAKPTLVSA
ncbi:hypothetical protein ASE01_20095 [Nocardioides sp. Root190]|uniref:hypothetical protein n=1 Tax=Nocardioides sp. Root190 TaxID=1736488 RepID=UPI00070047BE|nr:hypothetical protein [Nocardioides sp. Root190]KRB73079.1 hypothetical protein ASE01_20095 [Nocardioides sp. Root190]